MSYSDEEIEHQKKMILVDATKSLNVLETLVRNLRPCLESGGFPIWLADIKNQSINLCMYSVALNTLKNVEHQAKLRKRNKKQNNA